MANIYNRSMSGGTIESLLKAANSAPGNDASVNVATRRFADEEEASVFFREASSRLLRIEDWRKRSSLTTYDLFNDAGETVNEEPIGAGKYIRISLHGGGKYDWVRVMSVTDDPDEFVVTVKTSHDPTENPPDPNVISHFFGPEASNNFCFQRNDKAVAFYVIGLNERTNTGFADSLIESARNAAIANVGYYTGIQDKVWKEFASNFLKTDEEIDK